MVIYCKSVHFRGFSSPGSPGQAFYEMASFSENRILRLLQESGEPLPCTLRVPVWPSGLGPGPTWLPTLPLLPTPHPLPVNKVSIPCSSSRAGGRDSGTPEASLPDHPVPSSGNNLVRHNVNHLSRIYPAGRRTDSSNYSPVEMWNGGCQIGMHWLGPGGGLAEGQGPGDGGDRGRARCRNVWAQELVTSVGSCPPTSETVSVSIIVL